MPYTFYKLVHFFGIFTMVMALAITATHVLRGGTWRDTPHRGWLVGLHGLAAFLVLLGGFGMLARLGIIQGGLPGWVNAKVVVWFVLLAAIGVPFLGRGPARALVVAIPFLAVAAAAFALYKPF